MNLIQLTGKYSRLQLELSTVAGKSPLHRERLARLEEDLHSTQRQIGSAGEPDEHCDDLGALGVGLSPWDAFERPDATGLV